MSLKSIFEDILIWMIFTVLELDCQSLLGREMKSKTGGEKRGNEHEG